ncbi:MAG: glycosyltransferase [Saprospiraceae bacterium]|nr:glycosyltransferase [Saprospiraceae bacterium]
MKKYQVIVDVLIPAFNEEESIGRVIGHLPAELTRKIIVANNGSTDNTKKVALESGATVVDQTQKGYGNACLKAMEYINNLPTHPDILVFIDGDFSDYPEQLSHVILPITNDDYDMVIGSRVLGKREKGALLPQQRLGNAIACSLIKLFYGYSFTDLGPFRAIRYQKLLQLDMQDRNFGWTVEMQIKAAKQRLKCTEVAVDYRKRIGQSKVSGTFKGSIKAGYKILWTLFKYILK